MCKIDMINTQLERRWSVYYELYVDILFVINFMMDYMLLIIVKGIVKCSTTHVRILLASIIGSLLTCGVIVLPIPYIGVKLFLFHIVINSIMIIVGFQIKTYRQFIANYIFLYIGGFLLGGVFEYFQQYVTISSLFFVLAVGSYWSVRGIWKFIGYYHSYQSRWYDVELYIGKEMLRVKALLDTGNGLVDTYTGEPVHIMNQNIFQEFFPHMSIEKARYIPYHSLGNRGTMLVINVNRMHLIGAKEIWIDSPLIALCEDEISINNSYQMIINPDIL